MRLKLGKLSMLAFLILFCTTLGDARCWRRPQWAPGPGEWFCASHGRWPVVLARFDRRPVTDEDRHSLYGPNKLVCVVDKEWPWNGK
jgi:hypothetical protein